MPNETCFAAVSHYKCVSKNKTANYNTKPKAADGESSDGIRPKIVSDEQGRRSKRSWQVNVGVTPSST